MPSLTSIRRPLLGRCAVREDRLKPTRQGRPPTALTGAPPYRLRRAPRRQMTKLPTPIRPCSCSPPWRLSRWPPRAAGRPPRTSSSGRVLFIEKCGTCHTLAEAGTTAQIGPTSTTPSRAAREAGEGGETIEGVVEAQVEFPRPSNGDPAVSMPADVVEGQDLEDVAAYVGTWAGVPGAAPPKVPGGPGAQVFANNGCGGCHTLAAAKSGGTVGPDLDEVLSGQSAAMVQEAIVDPNKVIATGLPAERDAAQLRRNADARRTRRPGPVPGRIDRRQRRRRAARRSSQGRLSRPAAAGGRWHHPVMSMRERLLRSRPELYAKVTAGRPGGAGADRPHRRRSAAHRLRPRLPGLAQVLRRDGAAARHPRGDRVRQPAADRLRRLRRDRRRRPRLLPPAVPLAPGAVRGAAAPGRDRPGDPRRPGRQVPPGAGPGDEPLHPLDAAPRRLLRPRLVLALRAGRAARLERPARRLGGAGADPARPADDPRRDDRDRRPGPTPAPTRASSSTASTSRAPAPSSGSSSATRRSPPSSAWRRSPSGSCSGAREATGGRRGPSAWSWASSPSRAPSAASSGPWSSPPRSSGSTSPWRRRPGWRCSGRWRRRAGSSRVAASSRSAKPGRASHRRRAARADGAAIADSCGHRRPDSSRTARRPSTPSTWRHRASVQAPSRTT